MYMNFSMPPSVINKEFDPAVNQVGRGGAKTKKQKQHLYFVACHETLLLHTPELCCRSNARNDVFPGSSHPFDLLRDIDSTPVLRSFEHINRLSFFQVDECTILHCTWYNLQADTHSQRVLNVHFDGSHGRLAAKGKRHEHVCILSAWQGQPETNKRKKGNKGLKVFHSQVSCLEGFHLCPMFSQPNRSSLGRPYCSKLKMKKCTAVKKHSLIIATEEPCCKIIVGFPPIARISCSLCHQFGLYCLQVVAISWKKKLWP